MIYIKRIWVCSVNGNLSSVNYSKKRRNKTKWLDWKLYVLSQVWNKFWHWTGFQVLHVVKRKLKELCADKNLRKIYGYHLQYYTYINDEILVTQNLQLLRTKSQNEFQNSINRLKVKWVSIGFYAGLDEIPFTWNSIVRYYSFAVRPTGQSSW